MFTPASKTMCRPFSLATAAVLGMAALVSVGLPVSISGQAKPAAKESRPETPKSVDQGTFAHIKQPDPQLLKGGRMIRVLSFNNQSIRSVISLFKQKTDLNIVASDKVKGNFSAYLNNVRARDALRNILAVNNLYFIEDKDSNLIRIVTRNEFRAYAALHMVKTETFQIYMGDVKTIARSVTPVLTAGISRFLVDERTNRIMITDLPEKLAEARSLIENFTRPPHQILIETRIVEVQLDDQTQFGIDWSALDIDNVVKGAQTTFIPRDPNDSTKSANPGLSIIKSEGTPDGGTVEAFLHALGRTNHIDSVSSPKILVEHSKKAKIHVGRQIPYNETITQGLTSNQSSSFKFLDTGTKLIITPQITSSGEIYMNLELEVSSSPEFIEFGADGAVGKAPLKDSTTLKTTVVIEDRDLIVLGGLIRKDKTKERKGIPLLMDIPILGYLFGYTDWQDNNKETVIFITPTIVRHRSQIDAKATARQKNLIRQGDPAAKLPEPVKE